jgi:hypothetical protein
MLTRRAMEIDSRRRRALFRPDSFPSQLFLSSLLSPVLPGAAPDSVKRIRGRGYGQTLAADNTTPPTNAWLKPTDID